MYTNYVFIYIIEIIVICWNIQKYRASPNERFYKVSNMCWEMSLYFINKLILIANIK